MNLDTALIQAVYRSGAPGAVACVGNLQETLFHGAAGYQQKIPSLYTAQESTLYDLASLTKVVCTTTSLLMLRDEGKLDLRQPLSEFVPMPEFNNITLWHLLTHTSGLAALSTWFREITTTTEMIQRIAREGIEAPPDTRRVYSDLGFILLGRVVEIAGRDSLDALCRRRIFDPLGMNRTCYKPPAALKPFCAATEDDPWRGRMIQGEVHDENAYALGGVSGHAGLFSTAGDLSKFCRALLGGQLLSRKTLEEMTRFNQVPFYPWQALGWRVDPWQTGAEGFLRTRGAFGHSGWTGTSLWLDRDAGNFCILLSNTPHPQRSLRDNRTLRQTFHAAASQTLYPRTTNTHSGLDRLLWDNFEVLRGKRIALLTHHAAVDERGWHILDVMKLAKEVRLVRVFTPEHGLRGKAEAGEAVGTQEASVPVVSLYGERKAPFPDELRDIDVMVVDLQDAGARYYTYPATLKACMSVCAAMQKHMVILDRPNPLGGTVLEGPIAESFDSLVCWAPVPVRHGMTLGEIAYFLRDNFYPGMSVEVVPLDAWQPEFQFPQTALPWVPPSPNLPSFESALLYVGMCLFEGTNLNEGRGTQTPFQQIGAPWLNPQEVLRQLDPSVTPGVKLSAATYTPVSIPGMASSPRFEGQKCQGVACQVTDPAAARPFGLAVGLLEAIRKVHGETLEFNPMLDTLAGGTWLREVLSRGGAAAALAALHPALEAFDQRRPKLYSPEALKE